MRFAAPALALLLQATAPPPAAAVSLAPRLEALRRCLAAQTAAGRFSGVVAVGEKGRIRLSAGFGSADPAGSRPNGLDTRFNLASTAKMFTAVAIGQLAEAGRLRFDDPVGRHLPGLPADVAAVTIEQLLTHRSGLGDYLRPQNREAIRSARRAADLVPLAVEGGLAFAPGTRQAYSNSGYVLLGAVVERLSGLRYADYVRSRIFAPAGMREADVDGEGERAAAMTARSPDGSLAPERHPAPVIGGLRGSPAGGALASARDLLRFGEALRRHRLISARTEAALWAPRVPAPDQPGRIGRLSYGYGFARYDLDDGEWLVGHGGGSLGVNAEFEYWPASGRTAVALSNYDPPAASEAMAALREGLRRGGTAACPRESRRADPGQATKTAPEK